MPIFISSLLFAAIGQDIPSALHQAKTDGAPEHGRAVMIPAGPSDFMNVRYDLAPGTWVTGISISVADFGVTSSYPRVGLFGPNLNIDPSGNTPDLALPYSETQSPSVLGHPPLDHQDLDLIDFPSPSGPTHAVVQFPPGNPGLLGVGSDEDRSGDRGGETPSSFNPFDSSGWTLDGYSTPSFPFSYGEFGLNVLIDPCPDVAGNSTALLRLSVDCQDLTGDYIEATTAVGEDTGLALWAPLCSGSPPQWMLFFSVRGVPVAPASAPLGMTTSPNGCAYTRICTEFPDGIGPATLEFVAVTACPGISGSLRISNEITLHVR